MLLLFFFSNFNVRGFTASISLSSPLFHLHAEDVLFWIFNLVSVSCLRGVQHVDRNSESNKCGFVTAAGLRPVLPLLSWIKCNITRTVRPLRLYICLIWDYHLGSHLVLDVKWWRTSNINFRIPEVGLFYSRIKRHTLHLSLISLYCLKLIQKRFCWKHSLLLSF